jgi:hypothetical protein
MTEAEPVRVQDVETWHKIERQETAEKLTLPKVRGWEELRAERVTRSIQESHQGIKHPDTSDYP